jgi:hypothetical protein
MKDCTFKPNISEPRSRKAANSSTPKGKIHEKLYQDGL